MEALPLYSDELVAQLEKQFPHRCPSISTSDRQIWFDAGARAVVDMLVSLRDRK